MLGRLTKLQTLNLTNDDALLVDDDLIKVQMGTSVTMNLVGSFYSLRLLKAAAL